MPADAEPLQAEEREPHAARSSPDDKGNLPYTGPRISDHWMRETRSYKPPEPDLA